jgi:hypothetical protein
MSQPFSNVLFGRILDALNEDPNNVEIFKEGVKMLCIAFAVLGAINLFTASIGVSSVSAKLPL